MVARVLRGGEGTARLVPSIVVAVSVASAALGAVLAAGTPGLAQSASDSPSTAANTPETTSDTDAVRRPPTIEESFPSLSSVPTRPTPSTTAAERVRITNSLAGDRQNAQYTSQALRGGEEAAAPSPRSLPPVAASEMRDPNEERRQAAAAKGITPFGSYQRRADGGQVPPPLPSTPEAASYSSRPAINTGSGYAASVPRAVARPSAQADASADPAAPRPTTGAVRPLKVPPTVASLPAPDGQEQRQVAAGPTPRVIASISSAPAGERAPVPSPASVAAARGTTTLASAEPAPVGSRYAPPAPAPQIRVAGGAQPAVAPGRAGTAPAPAPVETRSLALVTAGASRELEIPAQAPPGVIVADIYQQQLAETRSPRNVPTAMPQFEASRAPALPVTGVPMTAAMQAALGGAAPPRVRVHLDTPQDSGRRAAAPATRATTAAAAAGSASGSGTVIGFAAGSIDLSPAARESIRQMASALHSGAAQVRIVGYARAKGDGGDSIGAFGLSIDRANAVAAELMAAGVPAQAVKVEAIVADAGAASQRSRGKGPEAVVFVE